MVSRCNARWEISPRRRYESTRRRSDSWAASSFIAIRVPGLCQVPEDEHGAGKNRAQRKIPVDLHFIVRLRSMGQGKIGASQFSLRGSVQEETVFAVLSCLKRFCGTKRLLWYILYSLKRLFGTKLCGQYQSGPENGVNNRPFCHRFFKSRKTV